LQPCTSERIQRVEVAACVVLSAQPAKLIVATHTSHVVASCVLFHWPLALWTELDFVLARPGFVLLVLDLVAGLAGVPLAAAEEAVGGGADWAGHLRTGRTAVHIAGTVGFGAPAESGVFQQVVSEFKALVFLIHIRINQAF